MYRSAVPKRATTKTPLMKKVLIKILLPLAVLLYAGPLCAQAQGRVSGQVADAAHKPLEGATVSLLKARDSSLVKVFITGAEGYFEFLPIRPDTCFITVDRKSVV